MTERECVICGAVFPVDPKAYHKKQTCSLSCARKKGALSRFGPPKQFKCRLCGKVFKKRRGGSKDSNTYCSRECAFKDYKRWINKELKRDHWPERSCRVYFKQCSFCGKLFTAKRSNCQVCSTSCRNKKRYYDGLGRSYPAKPMDRCRECGEYFLKEKAHKKYCSKKCQRARGRRRASKRAREALGDSYIKKILLKGSPLGAADIPHELIEVKRLQLTLMRELRR